jgi:hypothetical protein
MKKKKRTRYRICASDYSLLYIKPQNRWVKIDEEVDDPTSSTSSHQTVRTMRKAHGICTSLRTTHQTEIYLERKTGKPKERKGWVYKI